MTRRFYVWLMAAADLNIISEVYQDFDLKLNIEAHTWIS